MSTIKQNVIQDSVIPVCFVKVGFCSYMLNHMKFCQEKPMHEACIFQSTVSLILVNTLTYFDSILNLGGCVKFQGTPSGGLKC